MISEKRWYVYMLQCKDGSLYTGITDDIQKRLDAHRSGKGAKYTRGRGPLTLKYLEICESKGDALRREIENQLYAQNLFPNLQADILKLIESLEDNDDVQEIYHNWEE